MSAGLLRWISDEEPAITLICASSRRAYSRATSPIRTTGCIADLNVALPAQMLACGASAVSVDVESCTCEGARARERFEVWRELLSERVHEYREAPPKLRKAEIISITAPPVSRRALFGLGSNASLPVDLDATEHAQLLEALALLGIDVTKAEAVGAPKALHLSVNGCVACGVCVAGCPSGALALTTAREGGVQVSTLTHDRAKCVGAGGCARLCPEHAISEAEATWAQIERVELARVTTAKCRKCGSLFKDDGQELCPTCRHVTADPFGSWLPPGFERK